MMKSKIGINHKHEKDSELIKELLDLMYVFKLDYTNTFIKIEKNCIDQFDFMRKWHEKLMDRKKLNKSSKIMINSNPKIIPRNHIIEKILNESEKDNYSNLNKLILYLNDPYNSIIPKEYKEEPTNEEKIHQTFCGT